MDDPSSIVQWFGDLSQGEFRFYLFAWVIICAIASK